MKRRVTNAHAGHGPALLAALALATLCGSGSAASAEERNGSQAEASVPASQPPARSISPTARTISDPGVRPAGGGHCQQCPSGRCHHAPAGPGHHHGCREGACVPYCPVRPHQFGFYGTRWRKWPGQDVVPVSAERAVTPAVPPRSAVPGPDEESMSTQAGDMPLDGGDSAGPDAAQPMPAEVAPPIPDPEPAAPAVPQPPAEPALPAPEPLFPAEPAAPARPQPEAKPAPPEDENLFEVRTTPRARRAFPVKPARAATATGEEAGDVRATQHLAPADAIDVPPVPFDAAAETRRLRRSR